MLSRRTLLQLGAAGIPLLSAGAAAGTPDLTKSQLFLDDTWIEETNRLERAWESPEVYPEPVLRPTEPWEGRQVVMFGSVLRIGAGWRMYYMTYNAPQPSCFCLAQSTDGLHWEKPRLGLVEFAGSRANNILWKPEPGDFHDGPTVCHDPVDSAAPFKMMYYGSRGGRRAEYTALSKDGVVWQHQERPALTNTGDRTNLMPTRDHRGKFVAFLRERDMMKRYRARTVSRSESDDFIHWTDPAPLIHPDLLDPVNTELYGMAGFRYSGMYVGLLETWRGAPDLLEIELAWSHDGSEWRRPAKRKVFIGPSFPWNKGWSSPANTAPIEEGNQLWFYFGGRSTAHAREHPQSYGAIGLATMTVDRFAAIHGDFLEGRLITKPMTWPGGDLAINSSYSRYREGHPNGGGGEIFVEVQEEKGTPVDGFSGQNRAPCHFISPALRETKLKAVRWGARSLNELAGRRIRLVFLLRDARLYSFRAQPI